MNWFRRGAHRNGVVNLATSVKIFSSLASWRCAVIQRVFVEWRDTDKLRLRTVSTKCEWEQILLGISRRTVVAHLNNLKPNHNMNPKNAMPNSCQNKVQLKIVLRS